MKQEKVKSPKKGTPDVEDIRIDIYNDDELRANGIWRPFDVTPRDPSVWTKTKKEKEAVRIMRAKWKNRGHFPYLGKKQVNIRAKLIIYLNKDKNKYKGFDKSVISTECYPHNIDDILLKYVVHNKRLNRPENLVLKYSYNGKTYAPNERPFWG